MCFEDAISCKYWLGIVIRNNMEFFKPAEQRTWLGFGNVLAPVDSTDMKSTCCWCISKHPKHVQTQEVA